MLYWLSINFVYFPFVCLLFIFYLLYCLVLFVFCVGSVKETGVILFLRKVYVIKCTQIAILSAISVTSPVFNMLQAKRKQTLACTGTYTKYDII